MLFGSELLERKKDVAETFQFVRFIRCSIFLLMLVALSGYQSQQKQTDLVKQYEICIAIVYNKPSSDTNNSVTRDLSRFCGLRLNENSGQKSFSDERLSAMYFSHGTVQFEFQLYKLQPENCWSELFRLESKLWSIKLYHRVLKVINLK